MLDQSTVCLRPVYFYFYRPLKQQSKSNITDVRPVYCMSKTSIFLFHTGLRHTVNWSNISNVRFTLLFKWSIEIEIYCHLNNRVNLTLLMLDQFTVCLRPVYFYFYRSLKQQGKSNITDVRPVYCVSKTSIFLFL
jgi:short-subunit dehydrogenase involved in D-alanine esterification of teichoic acids